MMGSGIEGWSCCVVEAIFGGLAVMGVIGSDVSGRKAGGKAAGRVLGISQ
jgi:hypothetical protein